MKPRFLFAVVIVFLGITSLILVASRDTARAVVTVEQLLANGKPQMGIQLGGRVAEDKIDYQTSPSFLLNFKVHDIPDGTGIIPVRYEGMMPDTLQKGRDVILEGDFDGEKFVATSLLTQCPSKYEPPLPGESK